MKLQQIDNKEEYQQSGTRTRILEAAIRCFANGGFHATSMQQICSDAGMSPGSVYRHFVSKDQIIEAIAELERQHNSQFLSQMDVQTNVLETVLDAAFAYLRGVGTGDWGNLCCDVLAESRRNPAIRSIFQRNLDEAHGALRAALVRARDNGEVDASLDLDVLTATLLALGDGLVVRMPFAEGMTPDQMEPALRELIRRMVQPDRKG
jgi:AcrR family transcriptional regulator